MIYYYNVSYHHNTDTFYAFVDNAKNSDVVFTIDNTHEVCKYIESGVMNHIDDVDGLEMFLIKNNIIKMNDTILIREENLW